ncbi:MAG TPA: type VI secretion system protein TssA [Acetobacteraceae bacterium]|nr:type VI secretion system protein TssA [Acetobacteraceae bacterium]
MALPDGFDLEALLAPIPGDAPQGVDIREDFSSLSPYNRLRDARSEARDAEKMLDNRSRDADGEEVRDPAPLWRTVRDVGLKTLTETAKDLEVAAWVTEAYVRSHGLNGLTAGAKLIAGLAESYWDDVFPLPDDYGVETRVAPVTGLNGREGNGSLIQPLHKLTLYVRPDGTPFAVYQYDNSAQLGSLDAERRAARIEAGAVPFDDVEREARALGSRTFARVRQDAREALEAWQHMADLLDEKASEDPPSTSAVRDLVRHVLEIANRYAPPEESTSGAGEGRIAGADAAGDMAAGGGIVSGIAVPAGQVVNREDALRTLENIATFFRRTEPVSPLAYTIEEAVRRGRMTWPDLLEEIVPDRDSRNAILTSLGIKPPPPPDE